MSTPQPPNPRAPFSPFPVPDAQPLCPLFNLLPLEIRQPILEYALTPSTDTARRLPEAHIHPVHIFHSPITISLLQTCKAIYNEARLVPLRQTEHNFWLRSEGYIATASNKRAMPIWTRTIDRQHMKLVTRLRISTGIHDVDLGKILRTFKYTTLISLTLDMQVGWIRDPLSSCDLPLAMWEMRLPRLPRSVKVVRVEFCTTTHPDDAEGHAELARFDAWVDFMTREMCLLRYDETRVWRAGLEGRRSRRMDGVACGGHVAHWIVATWQP